MASPHSFAKKQKSSNTVIPTLNFSPMMDMINMEYLVGPDGITYGNGGICRNNAVTGGNNTQKTGQCVLMMARTLVRYHTSIVVFFDIEATFNVSRLADEVDREIGIPGYFYDEIMDVRFFYYSRNDIKDPCDGNFVHQWFKDRHADVRQDIKDKVDIYMSTPYPDNDGGAMRIISPILTITDSISEMHFAKTSAKFQEEEVDTGGAQKTRDLVIGNQRRIVYEDCDVLGGEFGAFQVTTAQVTDIVNMTGQPLEKETVFLGQGKKLKGPKSLLRIPQIGYRIIRGSALKSGQEWMYPNPFGSDATIGKDAKENPDLLFYTTSVFRNKSGASGGNLFFIGSQSLGIQEGLSMYHALKTTGMFGLDGSAISHACVLMPDCKVGRTTVWKKSIDDRKFYRALVICYQMWFMQTFWLTLDHRYRITPQELFAKIKELGIDWDDILENTVDFWFTNPDIKKHTVTTMELLKIALGERKPYWLEAKK